MNPSLADQRSQAEQDALKSQVMPAEQEQARLKSLANLYSAQADVLKNHPAPQYQLPAQLSYPERQQAEIPTRPQAQLDPMSAGLAALAGIVDPRSAGAYGAMPLQAGVQHADQQYNDHIRNYQMATAQLAQQYEDQLNQRNDQIRYGRENASANLQNAEAQRGVDIQSGNLGAQAGAATDQANTLGGFLPREQAAAQSGLTAQQTNRTIGEQLQQNAATQQYNLGQSGRDNQVLRDMLNYGGRVYGAQQRLSGVQDTNDARVQVGAGHDDTSTTNTNTRANASTANAQTRAAAMVQGAQIRAASIQSKLNGIVQRAPIGLREHLNRAGQIYAQAEQQVSRAQLDADKAFTQSGNPEEQRAAYVNNFLVPYQKRAKDALDSFNAVGNAPPAATVPQGNMQGPPNPNAARPAAAPNRGAAAPARPGRTTLPPGFSDVHIGK